MTGTRRGVRALLTAAATLLVLMFAAAALAAPDWGRAEQDLAFPWVSDVPPRLLLVFLVTALVAVVATLLTWRAVAPEALGGVTGLVASGVVVLSAALETWNTLYLSTLLDPIIPVFVPVEFALPVLLVGLLLGVRTTTGRAAALALLAAAPVATLNVLGEGIRTDPAGGLLFALVFGAFGVAFGLLIGVARNLGRPRPA